MLLDAEIKDDNYAELPRQQQAQYAYPAQTYLKADASTGRHYVDLNEASKTYRGAWLFGEQEIEIYVDGLQAQWHQWCPIPAGIADGVLLRGNVIYVNPNKSYRTSSDVFEGEIQTEGGVRCFVGHTTHTFVSRYLPGGTARVEANLNIPLTQQLAYNPMVVAPSQQLAYSARTSGRQPAYYRSSQNYNQQAATATYDQEPEIGF